MQRQHTLINKQIHFHKHQSKYIWALTVLFLMFSVLSNNSWAKTNEVKVAEQRVISVSNHILQLLDRNKTRLKNDPNALSALVKNEILPFIDFDAMAKLTLGKHWRSATPDQRRRFTVAYKNMLIRTYANRLLEYAGATMKPKTSVPNRRPGYVTVRTVVVPKNGAPIAANYEVRNKSGQWKAYNIEINGINLVTNFRTNFTREISAKGMEALIRRLEKSDNKSSQL